MADTARRFYAVVRRLDSKPARPEFTAVLMASAGHDEQDMQIVRERPSRQADSRIADRLQGQFDNEQGLSHARSPVERELDEVGDVLEAILRGLGAPAEVCGGNICRDSERIYFYLDRVLPDSVLIEAARSLTWRGATIRAAQWDDKSGFLMQKPRAALRAG